MKIFAKLIMIIIRVTAFVVESMYSMADMIILPTHHNGSNLYTRDDIFEDENDDVLRDIIAIFLTITFYIVCIICLLDMEKRLDAILLRLLAEVNE